jgi:hypothetical protein
MNYGQLFQQAGHAYGTDPNLLLNIGKLESGLRPDAWNKTDSNAQAGTPSKGIMQFIESTFAGNARHAKDANPAAWAGVPMQWLNPKAQALAASWAIANGHGSQWTTYDRAKAMGSNSSGANRYVSGGGMNSAPHVSVGHTGGTEPGYANALAFVLQGSPYEGLTLPTIQAPSRPKLTTRHSTSGVIATGYKQLQHLGESLFGLKNDPGDHQTTGGTHTAGSEHYAGRAIDFGTARNSRSALNAWKAYAKKHGYDVLDEGNHIHVSLPGGGV